MHDDKYYCSKTLVKYAYYAFIGTRQLDGRWEENVDKASLTSLLSDRNLDYTIVSTTAPGGALSMRHSYQLFVVGRVSQQDSSDFTSSLEALWQKTKTGNII